MTERRVYSIGEFVDLYQHGDETIEQRRQLVHHRRSEIERQIAKLQDTFDFITYKCWFYDTASEAETCDVPREMPKEKLPPDIAVILEKCQIHSVH